MENSQGKSIYTVCLDLIRNILILIVAGYLIYLLWDWHWFAAIIGAIPVYIIVMNIIGFLTLPLYALSPENRRIKEKFDEFENL